MKPQDIIRVAYRRSVRSLYSSLYAKSEEIFGRSNALEHLENDFLCNFWWQVNLLSQKRRAKRYDLSGRYGDAVIEGLKAIGYGIEIVHYSDSRIKITLNPLSVEFIDRDGEVVVSYAHINGRDFFRIPPEDFVLYLIAFNDYCRNLPQLLEEFMTESHKIYKTERVLLTAAEKIIENIYTDLDIDCQLSIDKTGRILCILSHKQDLSYHKSCRSDLNGLADALGKTIPKLTAYRFTGYVEDV